MSRFRLAGRPGPARRVSAESCAPHRGPPAHAARHKKKVRQKARSQEVVFSRGPPRIVRHTDPGGIRACRTSSRWALCARGPHMKARSTDHSAAARSEGHCASGSPRKGTIVSHFPIRGCDCGHSPTNRRGAIFEWDSLATWSLPRGAAASERKALSCTLPHLEWCC